MTTALLSIKNLQLRYGDGHGAVKILHGVDLEISPGETVAVVGESGSGKSTVALSVMGLLAPNANVEGSIKVAGTELVGSSERTRRKFRGGDVSMVSQDPFTSLNPSLTIGEQVSEALIHNQGMARKDALDAGIKALSEVGLPNPSALVSAYPHQLSGGMQQRVLIASAIVGNPKLLILDEPTTALDVTVEAQILDLLENLQKKRGLAMLFITHNLGVVNRIADRVCVLYAGEVVENGQKMDVLGHPNHPYTKGLLASLPKISGGQTQRISPIPGRLPDPRDERPGCIFLARCPFAEEKCSGGRQSLVTTREDHTVRCWKSDRIDEWPAVENTFRNAAAPKTSQTPLVKVENLNKRFKRGRVGGGIEWGKKLGLIPWPQTETETVHAVDGISLEIDKAEIVGLVGESGSGKSTFGRTVLGLIKSSSGTTFLNDTDIATMPDLGPNALRKQAQIVFQNPDSSLNPRRSVGDALARVVALHTSVAAEDRRAHIETLLEKVGLPSNYYSRYPHQMSGGEKQRVGIARALATNPSFIVCDEPVSALDVSVQATVLNLLHDIRDEFGLSYLFITHDLTVVSYLADRIAVMYSGRLCEIGTVEEVLSGPYHPYTEALLSAVPLADPKIQQRNRIRLLGDGAPSEKERGGCPFHSRCPRMIGNICETKVPPTIELASGHKIACHIPVNELPTVSPL